jgi:WXG100 family type VII secretion target
MGGSQYTAEIETMTRAAGSTRDVNAQVQAILAQLRGKVGEVSGFWEGDAKRAFEALMEVWDSRALQLSQALDGIAEAMDASRVTYTHREEDTSQAMSTITQTLG